MLGPAPAHWRRLEESSACPGVVRGRGVATHWLKAEAIRVKNLFTWNPLAGW